MKYSVKHAWGVLLALVVMCVCFTACSGEGMEESLTPTVVPTRIPATGEGQENMADSSGDVITTSPTPTPTEGAPLIAGYAPFGHEFSPYFADSESDADVTAMTQLNLLTKDRNGGVIFNAIQGETVGYNGIDYTYKGIADISVDYDAESNIATYSATIRDDIMFSDGIKMTADDIIFNYYAYLDPGYRGPGILNSYDIVGLRDYQTQTTPDIFDKYSTSAKSIYAAGRDHIWSETDQWTSEEQEIFWTEIDKAWAIHSGLIVEYVNKNYASYADDGYCGPYTSAEVAENEGLRIAFGMVIWSFGVIDENGICTGTVTGNTWDMDAGQYPTLDDFAKEAQRAYGYDPEVYYEKEKTRDDEPDVLGSATSAFISAMAASEPELAGGIANISGIRKTGEYSVEIKVNGYSASDVYGIFGISVAPLHYYGNPELYDYEKNKFGFEFGRFNLSVQQQTRPLGAGPYKYINYEDGVVYFEANENYWLGCPKIKYVQFKEMNPVEIPEAVKNGSIDVGDISGSKEKFQEIQSYNDSTELTGDIITTNKMNHLGYGYIGICADNVLVGSDPASEESKSLRRAIATVIAAYREKVIEEYFGEAADIIQYPIIDASWASPSMTEGGYRSAFSTDVNGNDIYSSSMSGEDKYAAALAAAIEYFEAAGYTYDEASGKLTKAPEGAKLSYEAAVPGKSSTEHPSFAVFQNASAALATIGFELKINAFSDSEEFWSRLNEGAAEVWGAAWSSGIDPDMYQMYHSNGIADEDGYNSNPYHICDDKLDNLLFMARMSSDKDYRKSLYAECFEQVMDWAVEIPLYQKWNAVVFSTERVNTDTLAPDITTFWGWMNGIELLEMRSKETVRKDE